MKMFSATVLAPRSDAWINVGEAVDFHGALMVQTATGSIVTAEGWRETRQAAADDAAAQLIAAANRTMDKAVELAGDRDELFQTPAPTPEQARHLAELLAERLRAIVEVWATCGGVVPQQLSVAVMSGKQAIQRAARTEVTNDVS